MQPLRLLPWIQWSIKLLTVFVVPFPVIARSVERRVRSGLRAALAIGRHSFECGAALFGITVIYTAWCIAWLWSPPEEFSVQLGEKRFLDQLSGRALLIDVVIPWLFCIFTPVCLVIVCILIWSELMHKLLLIDDRVGYLLRVLYVIEEGGCWDRCVSLIHYLKNSSRFLPSLPIIITAYDLQQAGGRAGFSSRPQAVRQYSLFGHRLSIIGRRVGLIFANGRDYMGGSDPDPTRRPNVATKYTLRSRISSSSWSIRAAGWTLVCAPTSRTQAHSSLQLPASTSSRRTSYCTQGASGTAAAKRAPNVGGVTVRVPLQCFAILVDSRPHQVVHTRGRVGVREVVQRARLDEAARHGIEEGAINKGFNDHLGNADCEFGGWWKLGRIHERGQWVTLGIN
ncbi:unnamed protein product [Vitrella brassicaformis CCMP3155]|uniref:Uncharacterized protein n=1 Tax=Vitrella brassicaformis (strain CCMP3155) TaxID=1169540 RepID=A0A0G4G5D0_VITBC|nr:unnamed protein product [Vitrella brassicaformis CCMP3155]|eukprot:CEM23754.1 unnamed protein product [Vitrella brassicaformis CCMP3155]